MSTCYRSLVRWLRKFQLERHHSLSQQDHPFSVKILLPTGRAHGQTGSIHSSILVFLVYKDGPAGTPAVSPHDRHGRTASIAPLGLGTMTTCDRLTPRVSSLPTVQDSLFRWVVGAVHRMYAYKPKGKVHPARNFPINTLISLISLSFISHAAPVTLEWSPL